MEREPAVVVEGLCKDFRLPQERVQTIKERVAHPLKRTRYAELNALRDVSFSVERGEFFGIVGRNGSGKSTLLKCLAGIYAADRGRLLTAGRVVPLIEFGVGFNPELPARDNVILNGVMLGLTPREAKDRFDAIVEFAGLENFTDLKMRNYSSGMMVRLAVAVATHVEADILLVDEVLAVGDAAFSAKSIEAFERMSAQGRTIIFVSHSMALVSQLCDRAMVLERGRLLSVGAPDEAADLYLAVNQASTDADVESEPGALR